MLMVFHKVNIKAVYINLLIFQIFNHLLPPTAFHFNISQGDEIDEVREKISILFSKTLGVIYCALGKATFSFFCFFMS